MQKPLKVAIYIRVSTLDQADDDYSLGAQEKTLRKWCMERKYEVYDLYGDRGISGKDIDHRPDMQRLLQDAKDKRFDIVLFWALSRFTRSVPDLYATMEKLIKWNIEMVSYTEPFDTTTPMGRAMTGIVGIFAQLERELTDERVKAAMLERAQQGKRTCHQVLGYDNQGKDTFVINNTEAEYVRFVYDNYLIYKNLSQVAVMCKERGYRGKRGKIPTAHTVAVILTRPIYCDYNYFNGVLYKGDYESIISVDVYNRVQTLLKRQGKLIGRKRINPINRINRS